MLLVGTTATAQTDKVSCSIRMKHGGMRTYELIPGVGIWTETAVRRKDPDRRVVVRIYPEHKRPVWVARKYPGTVALTALPNAESVILVADSIKHANPTFLKAPAVLLKYTRVAGHGACGLDELKIESPPPRGET